MNRHSESQVVLAYYCSGHGYGHATRVSALARHFLSLESPPTVYIVSSAPKHIFLDSLSRGARYRYADIDPVIVQPFAYRVDRRKSVDALKRFLAQKADLLKREKEWLLETGVGCVLSDAAFLGCLASKEAGVPAALVTNFTFDSVYSYLGTPLLDRPDISDETPPSILDIIPDDPIPSFELEPLVAQIYEGYRSADLLVRLPGAIPLPSFFAQPTLPAADWVDLETRRLKADIVDWLDLQGRAEERVPHLHPSHPFPTSIRDLQLRRRVIDSPLLVRPPTQTNNHHDNINTPDVYTKEGRSRFLSSIGIPEELHDPASTKILIVSFGGQTFKRPHTPNSPTRPHSRNASRENIATHANGLPSSGSETFKNGIPGFDIAAFDMHIPIAKSSPADELVHSIYDTPPRPTSRLATPNHIWIPGAPPASKPPTTPLLSPTPVSPSYEGEREEWEVPTVQTIPPTPFPDSSASFACDQRVLLPKLLPDESWIAIVCGVSKEQWARDSGEESDLPPEFYVAPRDVYMPDLTAVGDVLLGKLGYGTVSECVDSCTPFVYVSRPLFVEEHGLRLLLDREGVGVELSRESYEAGDWACAVSEAYEQGEEMKQQKRREMLAGIGVMERNHAGRMLAENILEWVHDSLGRR